MKFLRNIYLVLFLLFMCFISSCVFAKLPNTTNDDSSKQLKYIFRYITNHENPILNVSLIFKSGTENNTILELPSEFADVDNLFKNITDMTANGAKIEKTNNPSEIKLTHKPNEVIILNYNVKQRWLGPLKDFKNFHAPIFQKDYFQFVGNGVLIYPQSYKNIQNLTIIFDWQLQNRWKIANSYGANKNQQKIVSNLDDVLSALFIGGNYRFYNNSAKGGTILTAIRGKWPFQDEKFNTTVTSIINNERIFWDDNSFPYFLVSLIPIQADENRMTGTGYTNAFAVSLKSHYTPGYPLWDMLSHESFHTWNKPNIFDIADNYYWFSEGFTSYYAHLLNLRLGLINLPDYVAQYNETLIDYYNSPVNLSSLEQVKENFFKNPDIEQLPYQQGEILANNWNVHIKQSTHNQNSLDDLMRSFIGFASTGTKLSPVSMNKIAKKYKMENLLEDIHDIFSGHLVIPNQSSLGPCVYLINKMLAPYDPGFDVNTSKIKHIITSVNTESRAFTAGVRDGQVMISIEEHLNDVTQMTKIAIKEKNEIKIIKYYPYKGELKYIPQFVLDQTAWRNQSSKCLAWFK